MPLLSYKRETLEQLWQFMFLSSFWNYKFCFVKQNPPHNIKLSSNNFICPVLQHARIALRPTLLETYCLLLLWPALARPVHLESTDQNRCISLGSPWLLLRAFCQEPLEAWECLFLQNTSEVPEKNGKITFTTHTQFCSISVLEELTLLTLTKKPFMNNAAMTFKLWRVVCRTRGTTKSPLTGGKDSNTSTGSKPPGPSLFCRSSYKENNQRERWTYNKIESPLEQDNLVFSTGLIRWIGHRKGIRKLRWNILHLNVVLKGLSHG